MDYNNLSYKADMVAPVSFGALPNDIKSTEFAKILSVDFGGMYDHLARQSEANAAKSANEIIDASSVKLGGFGSFNEAGAKFAQDISAKVADIVQRGNIVQEALADFGFLVEKESYNVKNILENGSIKINLDAKWVETVQPSSEISYITSNKQSPSNNTGRTH